MDPLREHRLYQASSLLRDYGFDLEEMPFTPDGNLPLPTDPKLAWAQMNLAKRPLEINRAEKSQLLCNLSSLRKLGIISERAAPFVLLDGRRLASQLAMF